MNSADKVLFEQVKKVFDEEIKLLVSMDGGKMTLVFLENSILGIRLGGACRFCSGVDYTIKNVVEKVLFEKFPEIKEIRII